MGYNKITLHNPTMPQPRQLIITKTKLHAPKTDTTYWRTKCWSDRLAALEEIRQEYHQWKYDVQPGFQRIYSVVKR
jgi:hypothetical protein